MFASVDPATGESLARYASFDKEDLEPRLEAARHAFLRWRELPIEQRAEAMQKLADALRHHQQSLARLMAMEMGKPLTQGLAEVEKSAWCIEHYCQFAAEYLKPQHIETEASTSYAQHQPLGVILGIMPWNMPVWLAFRFAAPTLMAGNSCLIKPDPHVLGCAHLLDDVIEEAGLPSGLLQHLPLENSLTEYTIRHPVIAGVSFTGSDRAGAQVAKIAASEVKPAVLELGGSDASIVLADADIQKAAEVIAASRLINNGQSCIAAKRILVEGAVYDAFIEAFGAELQQYRFGFPLSEACRLGPLARQDLRHNLHQQVLDSVALGANCLFGGEVPEGDGFYYPPTLLTDVTPEMRVFSEETFGPVAAVIKVADEAQAISLANMSKYGLGGSVWSTPERGLHVASRLYTGQVAVNDMVKSDPRLPSGGVKRSGYGNELGPQGILEFVNAQQVWIGGE